MSVGPTSANSNICRHTAHGVGAKNAAVRICLSACSRPAAAVRLRRKSKKLITVQDTSTAPLPANCRLIDLAEHPHSATDRDWSCLEFLLNGSVWLFGAKYSNFVPRSKRLVHQNPIKNLEVRFLSEKAWKNVTGKAGVQGIIRRQTQPEVATLDSCMVHTILCAIGCASA